MPARSADVVEVTPIEEVADAKQPEVVVQSEPIIVAPTTRSARVKGSWTQFYGGAVWNFENGQRYDLPLDLYDYLKSRECIYDTL